MMRKRIFLLWLFGRLVVGQVAAQQPVDVVILAASHYNGEPAAAYRPVIDKLKAYRPAMVFGEYLSPVDVGQLPADQAVARPYQRRLQYLRRRALTTTPLAPRAAAAARRQLRRKPLRHRQRIDLARHYAFNSDRGNAEYQLYLLEDPFKSSLSAADRAYYAQAFGPVDSLSKTARLVRPLSEYHKIVFPLLRELDQDRIYPMDCQRYDQGWNDASGQAYQQVQGLQAAFQATPARPRRPPTGRSGVRGPRISPGSTRQKLWRMSTTC